MDRILVVDDDVSIARILRDRLRRRGHDVLVAHDGVAALTLVDDVAVVLLDLEMPGADGFSVLESLRGRPATPVVVVITAHGDVAKAVRAMKLGAWDFIAKPFDAEHVEHVVDRAVEQVRLRATVDDLRREVGRRWMWVRGPDPGMARVAELVERVAPTEANVLLLGETGTGKEVVARALHAASRRSGGPFVAVNCAVLKDDLLESELFGHEKGAFTGATQARPGRIESAAGGTLLLDEVAELGLAAQAKLLRVLQEREYERLGSDRARKADVRVIAATHQDLEARVGAGTFRQDLYYRLKVISVRLPPLRDRLLDLPALAAWMLERHAREAGRPTPALSPEVLDAVARWPWPGNLRELSNAMERCVLVGGDPVRLEDLPEEMLVAGGPSEGGDLVDVLDLPFHDALREARRLVVRRALDRSGGHQTRAAEALGLTQPYLSRLMRDLGLR